MLADQPKMSTGPAAKYLGVSRRTLTRWVEAGLVQATILPSGRYQFLRDDLDAAVTRRTVVREPAQVGAA